MSKSYQYHQLDVFTNKPLLGNALAVVHEANDLSEKTMSGFARWTNLSETTFLLSPTNSEADYRVRIFTPGDELPFAGHPTLGSCYAWLLAGGRPHSEEIIVQECGVGLVKIRRDGTKLAFAAPPAKRTGDLGEDTLLKITSCLGISRNEIISHQWVDNGPGWCAIMLGSARQVLDLKPDFQKMGGLALGVIGPHPAGSKTDFEVRGFVPSLGVPEDPVTGSLNAGIAQWLIASGQAGDHYVATQGTVLRRNGSVFVDKVGNDIWIGGEVVACIEGRVTL